LKEDDIKALISRRRRQILVHSFLYYQMNTNIISDYDFDSLCRDLVKLQNQYPTIAKDCVYHNDFKDFDGSSGFDLPYSLPEIQRNGISMLKYREKQKSLEE
jgi:hypothetical protein